jgi:putative PIN family toxin of toxin-antitoxin system
MATDRPIRVFVDSDVIISSLISESGAAFTLISHTEQVELYTSNHSVSELNKVVDRLHLQQEELHNIIKNRLISVRIDQTYKKVQIQFADYVRDFDDAHVVAGAREARVSFLVSYNVRHFNAEKIRQDLQIILLTPGLFLQYLRSL